MKFMKNKKATLTLLILVLGLTVGPAYAQVGHWMLDDGTGSTIAVNSGTLGSSADGELTPDFDLNDDWVAGRIGTGALDCTSVTGPGPWKYVEIPGLNLNSNTMTITAWAKRHGDQFDFCGLVFNQEYQGIHVRTDGELRYEWRPGPSYPFGSGLFLPDEEWTFVALVIEPTQATFYMKPDSGVMQSATNVATHDAEAWADVTYIGRDVEWRMFNGTVDDVRIYDTVLSEGVLRSLYSYRVNESDDSTDVTEGDPGVSDTYEIELVGVPQDSIAVTINHDPCQLIVTPNPVNFVADVPDQSAIVTVSAVDDLPAEGSPHISTITHSVLTDDPNYTGPPEDVVVYITDNEQACGEPGTVYYPEDINKDCYVNLMDFGLLSGHWLKCTDPFVPLDCIIP